MQSNVLAEVIVSSTTEFIAEVYRDQVPPAFGTWVQVETEEGHTLLGLVSHVEVTSRAPNRQAVALGKTKAELRAEYPQIFELLQTTFRAQVIAHTDTNRRLRQTLPPLPAGIHDFVHACAPDHLLALGQPYDFLRTLVRNPDPTVPVDDLLVAVLAQIYEAHGGRHGGSQELIHAGRALSRLMNDDHERLHSILRRVAR